MTAVVSIEIGGMSAEYIRAPQHLPPARREPSMNRDAETVPARHETPDVAELRRLYEEAMRVGSNEMAWDEWTSVISQAAEDLFDATAERDALAAKVERARALHFGEYVEDEDRNRCFECGDDWPCPTVRALDEEPQP